MDSVIFGDFDIVGKTLLPSKADPVLLIDADAELTLSLAG